MAKKNKNRNKIFEEQVVDGTIPSTTDDCEIKDEPINMPNLVPDVSTESMVENVPDDPTQMDLLNDKLAQISQLTTELNLARQRIAELEELNRKLQADNDAFIISIAEQKEKAIQQTPIPLQVQLPNGKIMSVSGKASEATGKTNQNVISKRVNYIHSYKNNGYGTW